MRSLVALMTCIGCIALIHSFDKRILGVKAEKEFPTQTIDQLPVAVYPVAVPTQYIKKTEKTLVSPVIYANKANITAAKKRIARSKRDSLTDNFAQFRQNTLLQEIESSELLDNNMP